MTETVQMPKINGRPISRVLTTLDLITFSQKSEKRTTSTYTSYCRNLEGFLERNHLTLETVKSLHAKAFIQEMGGYDSKLGYDSINSACAYKRFMRTLFTSLGRKDDSKWLRDNLKDVQPVNKFKVDIPTSEILKLIEVTEYPELQFAWSVMAFDGLRPGEVLGLYYTDVDVEGKVINLQRHEGEPYFPKSRKVSDAVTPIPLNDFSISLFKQLPSISKRVVPCSYKTLKAKFYKYIELAEVKDKEGNKITPHKLRHVFGHLWRNNKGDLQVLKEMLRHSDIRVTMLYSAPTKNEITSEFEKTINLNIPQQS
jgi:integrase